MVFSRIVTKPLRRLVRFFSVTGMAVMISAVGTMAAEVEEVELPPEAVKAFKGQLVDLFEMPPMSLPVKELIAKIKKQRRMEFDAQLDSDSAHWPMQFLAFPNRRPVGQVAIEFRDDSREGRLFATHAISEPIPAAACVRLVFDLREEDGLMKGKKYRVDLVEYKGAESIILSTIGQLLLR